MIFTPTDLGACLVTPEPHADVRGEFARIWDPHAFAAAGLDPAIAQCSLSVSRRRGTLRGLHFQAAPHEEAKLVRCVRGAIHDVIVDLRPGSARFLRHEAVALSHADRRALYVPRGFAHGFQTLEDDTEVLYQISTPYSPEHARGVRWDDPAFGIRWPLLPPILLERDAAYPDFRPARAPA